MPNYRPGTAQGGANYSYLYNEPGGGGWLKKMGDAIASANQSAINPAQQMKAELDAKHQQNIARSDQIKNNAPRSESIAKAPEQVGKLPQQIKDPLAEIAGKSANPYANMDGQKTNALLPSALR